MQTNRVKKIIREGGLALGTYVGGIADPQIVEIIGHAGFDAAFIDMEHTSFDLRDVQLMVMAAERVGISPIVRPPGFDPAFLLRLLDMGVQPFNFADSLLGDEMRGAESMIELARRVDKPLVVYSLYAPIKPPAPAIIDNKALIDQAQRAAAEARAVFEPAKEAGDAGRIGAAVSYLIFGQQK